MLVNTFGETLVPAGSFGAKLTAFVGTPLIAMLAGVLFASFALVYMRNGSTEHLRESLGASLKPIRCVCDIYQKMQILSERKSFHTGSRLADL